MIFRLSCFKWPYARIENLPSFFEFSRCGLCSYTHRRSPPAGHEKRQYGAGFSLLPKRPAAESPPTLFLGVCQLMHMLTAEFSRFLYLGCVPATFSCFLLFFSFLIHLQRLLVMPDVLRILQITSSPADSPPI